MLVIVIVLLVFMECLSTVHAGNIFVTAEQQRFLDASKALSAGNMKQYQRYKQQLKGYVLYPYLEYEEVRRNLKDNWKVAAFLKKYPDTVMSQRLRKSWLLALGKRKSWKQYLKVYRDEDDTTLRCYYLDAAFSRKGMKKDLVKQARQLWLSGRTRPDACNGAFKHLYKHRKIKSSDYWERLSLAMQRGNTSLVKFLSGKLGKSQKQWLGKWRRMKKQPLKNLGLAKNWRDTPEARTIVLDGVERYSRSDAVAAWTLWHHSTKHQFSFSPKQINKVERKMALRAAWRHLPEASDMLASLPAAAVNKEVREWRVRSALRTWDWDAAQQALNALTEKEREEDQWQYWQARVFGAIGRNGEARHLYQKLKGETSYYGFLAAEKLGQAYQFNHEPVVAGEVQGKVESLSRKPAFRRIHELLAIGRDVDAGREWRFEIGRLPKPQKRVAAQLASNWGWHFSAIIATAAARHFKDLDLRFPLAYRDEVEREASRQGLPPSLVYGVIRRESAYRASVESPAGALGLMQLMPRTARHVGKKLGMKKLNNAAIKKVDNNIKLGSRYLREVMDKYNNNVILATASYNAGPNRVEKWLPDDEVLPADIWVDTITFDETRKYVKAVLFYSTIFDWKLDDKVDYTLRQRMRPVTPAQEINMAAKVALVPGG